MKAILFDKYGDPSVLYIGEAQKPIIDDNEVLIKVAAAGINRPDILQRQGGYPPPKGASEILGLEVSGKIVEIGKNIDLDFKGKEVCALVTGGGYAEYVKTTLATVLPVPKGLKVVDAAAIPETFFTVWTNLFDSGSLKKNEILLIHGGASGIGITAALIAKAMGIKFLTTVGSVKKKKFMEQLGSTLTINYQNEVQRSLGGVEYALNVNTGQEVHTISFQNISSTFKTNLITMQDALKGEAKKFLWNDGTNFNWVRLDKPMTFTEIADGRFSTQLVLRQQIQ